MSNREQLVTISLESSKRLIYMVRKKICLFSLFFSLFAWGGERALSTLSTLFEERDDLVLGEGTEFFPEKGKKFPAYRLQSFGNTVFELNVQCGTCLESSDLSLVVEGPLPSYGDHTPVGAGPLVLQVPATEKKKLHAKISLKEKGIYRVLIFHDAGPTRPPLKMAMTSVCEKHCGRPIETLPEILTSLQKDERKPLLDKIREEIRRIVADEKIKNALLGELSHIENTKDWKKLDRFPTLPTPHQISQLRPFVESLPHSKPKVIKPVVADLTEYVHAAKTSRDEPLPRFLQTPMKMEYGHFMSATVPKEELDQSPAIAALLNALATQPKSLVKFADPMTGRHFNLRTPEEFFKALLETGHTIELDREQTYANFISLVREGTYSKIPAWIDTGIELPDGTTLKVPMSHSQMAWKIKGPLVNARVAFFLGMFGAGFFPNIDERPRWTGKALKQSFKSEDGNEELLVKSMQAANSYLRCVQMERDKVGKGLPADGYGILGVCNDTSAALMKKLGIAKDDIDFPYPLMRQSTLPPLCTEWVEIFRSLPQDVTVTKEQLKDKKTAKLLLCRVLETTPYSLDSPFFPDEELRRQIKLAKEYVGETCQPGLQSRKKEITH